jgi:hypothetical protein
MKIRPGRAQGEPGPAPAPGPPFSRDAARCSSPRKVERGARGAIALKTLRKRRSAKRPGHPRDHPLTSPGSDRATANLPPKSSGLRVGGWGELCRHLDAQVAHPPSSGGSLGRCREPVYRARRCPASPAQWATSWTVVADHDGVVAVPQRSSPTGAFRPGMLATCMGLGTFRENTAGFVTNPLATSRPARGRRGARVHAQGLRAAAPPVDRGARPEPTGPAPGLVWGHRVTTERHGRAVAAMRSQRRSQRDPGGAIVSRALGS